MRKLTKQELRHDPFLEALEKLTGVMKKHGNRILWGAAAVFALIIAALIYTNQRQEGASEAEWRYLQAISLFSQGDTTNSIPIFRELIEGYGNTRAGKRARYYLGIHAMKQRQLDTAEVYFKSYLASNPKDAFLEMSTYGCLAAIAMDKGNMDEALSLYKKAERAAQYETYKSYYCYKAAKVARMSGKYEEAIEYLTKFENEYKNSPFRSSARKELSYVKGAQVVERG